MTSGNQIKINKLKVWHDGEIIKGIQAFYRGLDGKLIAGEENIGFLEKSYSCFLFELENFDYIKHISGSYNGVGFIDYLNVISFNGKKTKFGELNVDSKMFEIEIDKFEIPVCINGVLSTLKGKQNIYICDVILL